MFFLEEVKSGNWSIYTLQVIPIVKEKFEYSLSEFLNENKIQNLLHNQWKICQLEFQETVLSKN